jgi:hypothetical protein
MVSSMLSKLGKCFHWNTRKPHIVNINLPTTLFTHPSSNNVNNEKNRGHSMHTVESVK